MLAFDSEVDGLGEQLFAIKIELVAEPPDQTINVGRFVLGVPEPISRGGAVLPDDEFALTPAAQFALEETWCYRYNYSDAPMVPGWSPAVGAKEARAAVEPLLQADYYPAALAVFAAEQTGDERRVVQTRERAAATVLREVEHSVDTGEVFAPDAIEVRQAMEWAPSESAEDLLRRVEAELQAKLERQLDEE